MLGRLKVHLRSFRIYRTARFGWHLATDPVFRRDHLLLWRRPPNLYQHRSVTQPDRYPGIFTAVQTHLADRPAPRLLSFGCALGDEVFSLRERFPAATIKGIDINPDNIAACRSRHRAAGSDPGLEFEVNDSTAAEPSGAYDAVFCMAVFVRWQLREKRDVATCAPHLRFADFARCTAELARCVRPGGLFVIRNAMFHFAATAAAADFQCVLHLPLIDPFFPRFDQQDRRLPDAPTEDVVFRKMEAFKGDGTLVFYGD